MGHPPPPRLPRITPAAVQGSSTSFAHSCAAVRRVSARRRFSVHPYLARRRSPSIVRPRARIGVRSPRPASALVSAPRIGACLRAPHRRSLSAPRIGAHSLRTYRAYPRPLLRLSPHLFSCLDPTTLVRTRARCPSRAHTRSHAHSCSSHTHSCFSHAHWRSLARALALSRMRSLARALALALALSRSHSRTRAHSRTPRALVRSHSHTHTRSHLHSHTRSHPPRLKPRSSRTRTPRWSHPASPSSLFLCRDPSFSRFVSGSSPVCSRSPSHCIAACMPPVSLEGGCWTLSRTAELPRHAARRGWRVPGPALSI
jgi:hypothetical protein